MTFNTVDKKVTKALWRPARIWRLSNGRQEYEGHSTAGEDMKWFSKRSKVTKPSDVREDLDSQFSSRGMKIICQMYLGNVFQVSDSQICHFQIFSISILL